MSKVPYELRGYLRAAVSPHVLQNHHTFSIHRLSQQVLLSNQTVGFIDQPDI